MIDPKQQRINMVESQVRPSDITDRRIIRAMLEVPREAFVPPALHELAYMDEAVPVTRRVDGRATRALLAPRTFAKLVQLAEIEPDAVVLDVGCATGYSTAVLARLAKSVVALEVDDALAARAAETLRQLRVANAMVLRGRAGGRRTRARPLRRHPARGRRAAGPPRPARAAQGRRTAGRRDRRRRLRPRPGLAAHGQGLRRAQRLRCRRRAAARLRAQGRILPVTVLADLRSTRLPGSAPRDWLWIPHNSSSGVESRQRKQKIAGGTRQNCRRKALVVK